jgi:hypothetical protein
MKKWSISRLASTAALPARPSTIPWIAPRHCRSGQLIGEEEANHLMKIGVEKLKIRSVLTCESKRGCCAKCYGLTSPRPVMEDRFRRRHRRRPVHW